MTSIPDVEGRVLEVNISLWFAGHRSLARLASTTGASLVLSLSAYVAAGPAPVVACCPSATAVVAVSASPSTVGAGGSVTVTVHLTNPVSGVTSAAICYSLPNGSLAPGCQGPQIGPDSIALSLASGTPLDGVWQGVVAVPPAAASGSWAVHFVDATAGGVFARFDQLGLFGSILAGGNFTVTGGTDTTAPAIFSPTISPSTVGVGGTVTISARITDASGVAAAAIQTLPNTTSTECCVPMTLASGTSLDGIWQVNLIPTAPGNYVLMLVAAQDAAGNLGQIGPASPFFGSFTVSLKQDQSITFAPLADRILGEPPFMVAATASSGLPVAFTASGACSVTGSTVSLSGTGVCTITAAQAGNDTFNAAPGVSRSFNVLSRVQFAQGIIDAVSAMGLPPGASTSLTSKLQAYVASTSDGNQNAACGQLGAFVNYVMAQSGKQIPADVGALLLADAARLSVAGDC
jgi:hypothetical protein